MHQLYDLLYFCSGRPKIDRKVDFQLYDLLYFCSGRLKISRKVDFYLQNLMVPTFFPQATFLKLYFCSGGPQTGKLHFYVYNMFHF